MMGCLCYLRGKKMLAFLVTDGIVISNLSEEDQNQLGNCGISCLSPEELSENQDLEVASDAS
jgi:hypothetical protein